MKTKLPWITHCGTFLTGIVASGFCLSIQDSDKREAIQWKPEAITLKIEREDPVSSDPRDPSLIQAARSESAGAISETAKTFSTSRADGIWRQLNLIANESSGMASINVGEALSLSHALAETNPEGLISISLRLPAGELSTELCRAAFGQLAQRNPVQAWKQLEQLSPGRMEESATRAVLENWAASDPAAAAAALAQLPRPATETIAVVAEQWARTDPVAAWQWASNHGDLGSDLNRTVIGNALASTPERAMANAKAIWQAAASAGTQAEVASVIGEELAWVNPIEAMNWATSLPSGDRALAIAGATTAMAQAEPHAASERLLHAIQRLDAHEMALPELPAAATEVSLSLARQDASAAATWASHLPANLRDQALAAAITEWAATDASAAAEWISRQGTSPARDAAALALAQSIWDLDPEAAVAWARSASNTPERDAILAQWESTR